MCEILLWWLWRRVHDTCITIVIGLTDIKFLAFSITKLLVTNKINRRIVNITKVATKFISLGMSTMRFKLKLLKSWQSKS